MNNYFVGQRVIIARGLMPLAYGPGIQGVITAVDSPDRYFVVSELANGAPQCRHRSYLESVSDKYGKPVGYSGYLR